MSFSITDMVVKLLYLLTFYLKNSSIGNLQLIISIVLLVSIIGCTQKVNDVSTTVSEAYGNFFDITLDKQEILDIPYASAYINLKSYKQIFTVLAFADHESNASKLKWVTADKKMIVTKNGRVLKTLGLAHMNLAGIDGDIPAYDHKTISFTLIYDWQKNSDLAANLTNNKYYGFIANVTRTYEGSDALITPVYETLVDIYKEIVIFPTLSSAFNIAKIENFYWVDENGNVLHSRQYLGYEMEHIDFTVLKLYTEPSTAKETIAPALLEPSSIAKSYPLTVNINDNSNPLYFDAPARLSDILAQTKLFNVNLNYPLAVNLFTYDPKAKQETDKLKNVVLEQMTQKNLINTSLYNFIQNSTFMPRVSMQKPSIDLDQIRLNDFDNPLLKGQLLLSINPRKDEVTYLGAVDKNYVLSNQTGIAFFSLQHQERLGQLAVQIAKPKTSPVIIYPDGTNAIVDNNYWQEKQIYLPPLAIVYIPFAPLADSLLDQNIIKLLSQFKPTI